MIPQSLSATSQMDEVDCNLIEGLPRVEMQTRMTEFLPENTVYAILGLERTVAKDGQGGSQENKSDFIRRGIQETRGSTEGRDISF